MNSDLGITSEQRQANVPVTVFHITGWLDGQSEAQFIEASRNAYTEGTRYLLVEMSNLEMLTSAGIRALQQVYKIYTPNDENFKAAYFKLCSAPPQIYDVLSITGFLHSVPMYESIDSALESFNAE